MKEGIAQGNFNVFVHLPIMPAFVLSSILADKLGTTFSRTISNSTCNM